jgi:LuxR family maltose regulon positive regulatory protein
MNTADRTQILERYAAHSRRFDAQAARRGPAVGAQEPPAAFDPAAPAAEQALSPRELEVLQLVGDGLGNREIGERLFVAESTVKSHLKNLHAKLTARSRTHAVAIGLRRHLIS